MNVQDPFTPAPVQNAPAPAPRKGKGRLLLVLGSAVLIGGGAFALRGRFAAAPADAAELAAARQQELQQALTAFLGASSVEERASRVIGGEHILPLMQAYYTGREQEQLDAGQFVSTDSGMASPDGNLGALQLTRSRGLTPVTACFRKAAGGNWLLDWDIWKQSLDGQFRAFTNQPAEGQYELRVKMTRVADDTESLKVSLSDAFSTGNTMSFDITREDLRALYSRDLPMGATRTATVQLVWLNDGLTGTLSPVLRRHVAWGYLGLDGTVPEPAVPNRIRDEHHLPPQPSLEPAVLASKPAADHAVEATLVSNSTAAPRPSRPEPVSKPEQVAAQRLTEQ